MKEMYGITSDREYQWVKRQLIESQNMAFVLNILAKVNLDFRKPASFRKMLAHPIRNEGLSCDPYFPTLSPINSPKLTISAP